MKDWKQKIRDWKNYKNETGLDNEEFYPSIDFDLLVNFIEQLISERDKEWEHKIEYELKGINKRGAESDEGWWETSQQADFGEKILSRLINNTR